MDMEFDEDVVEKGGWVDDDQQLAVLTKSRRKSGMVEKPIEVDFSDMDLPFSAYQPAKLEDVRNWEEKDSKSTFLD